MGDVEIDDIDSIAYSLFVKGYSGLPEELMPIERFAWYHDITILCGRREGFNYSHARILLRFKKIEKIVTKINNK